MTDVMLIGEAWGEAEERTGLPFQGPAGWFLRDALASVGINYSDCYSTNVFNLRPQPKTDIINLCGPKSEAIPGLPALVKGKYANVQYIPELQRLYREINKVNPNIIIALGATATWALCHSAGIRAVRGAFTHTHENCGKSVGVPLTRQFKVLPTYHPAAVLREWTLRPIVYSDLDKAARNSIFPEVIRPKREVWIEPTLDDIREYDARYMCRTKRASIDIETKGDQITCVGFAPSVDSAIVIPFYSFAAPDKNYWPTLKEELIAWGYVKEWCENIPGVFQNGAYDMHRLWRTYGIRCVPAEDTMLLHHSLQPEMEKGLGFLATIYTEEASWKFMSRVETLKKED